MKQHHPCLPISFATVLAVALVAWLPVGAAAAVFQFGPIGVVFSQQAVQVNASHIGDPDQVPPEPSCQADIEFFDVTGTLLKRTKLTIPAGRTASVRLTGPDLAPGPRGKSPVRGHVTWDGPGTSSLCRASFEVVDLASGKAVLVGTPADRTSPFAIFGAIGVAEGQTFRLNVANIGPPDQSPCEVGLVIFGETGTVLVSELVTLPAGYGAHLDLAAGPTGRDLLRAMARGVPLRLSGGACSQFLFTVEVYQTANGIPVLVRDSLEP